MPAKPENVSEEVWQDWINFRKEIRKPLTETTCKQLAKKLAGCSDADAVLCNSIANGWQGIFPERIGTLQKNPIRMLDLRINNTALKKHLTG